MKNNVQIPIIIDTSPLLLLIVGAYNQELIKKFKRTESYNERDFEILFQFLIRKKVIVTPQVLTEVSNMAMELKRNGFQKLIDYHIETLKKLEESYIPKNIILQSLEVKKLVLLILH